MQARLPDPRRHPDHAPRRSDDRGLATAAHDISIATLIRGSEGAGPVVDTRWGRSWERVQLGLLAALAASASVSLFAAQAFLTLATLVWLLRLARRETRFERLPLDGPILAFIVWTLLSASFSPDPAESFRTGVKKLVLFVLVYIAIDTLRGDRQRERVMDALLLGAFCLGCGAIAQYEWLGYDTLDNRPTGFLGHWMTASGLAMGALVLAVARLAFRRAPLVWPTREDALRLALLGGALAGVVVLQRLDLFAIEAERLFVAGLAIAVALMATSRGSWPSAATSLWLTVLVVPVSAWALIVSRTRSAWLGAIAGIGLVAILRAPRLLWGLAGAVALVLIVRPAPVMSRGFIDTSAVDRYYMWQAGVDMIRDKPVFGQGPGIIPFAYERYRWNEAPNPTVPHLHNNVMHLAAERGVPSVAFWLWWLTVSLGAAYREVRRGAWDARWVAAGSMSFLLAILVAGMFEYNFGDSEVLYVILLASVVPLALSPPAEVRSA